MLKSLFEASVDKLNIPEEMKTAIKEINNVCLEAEGDGKDYTPKPKDDKHGFTPKSGDDLNGYTPVPKEDVEKAKKQKVNEEYKYEAYPSKEDAPKQQAEDAPKSDETKPAQAKEQNASNATSKEPSQANNAEQQQQAQDDKKGEQQNQANEKPAAPKYRRGADVATVQFFIRSRHPETELVGDGILGPKTIQAIQKVENLKENGKMDQATQQAFNDMLKEAKVTVKKLQEKLGVTADGLIGRQTLAAMNKANMNVTNLFTKQPSNEAYAAKQSAPAATQANAPQENPQVAQNATKQPAQQGNQQQAAAQQKNNPNNEVYRKTQDAKGTTEYYSGNISSKNMTPEEKKIQEQAEAKAKAQYFDGDKVKINPKTKKPYDEQIVLEKIQQAGRDAVMSHRMAKARAKQG